MNAGEKMSTIDLDDFFKKRDKKKKNSTKTKFQKIDTEEFAKHLEAVNALANVGDDLNEGVDVNVQSGTDATLIDSLATQLSINAPATQTTTSVNTHQNNYNHGSYTSQHVNSSGIMDEDWKPFESEDNKDYSGLRVTILQNWKNENDDDDDEVRQYEESDKKPSCPWSAIAGKQQTNDESTKQTEKDESDADDVYNTPQQKSDRDQASGKIQESTSATSSSGGSAYVPPHLRGKTQQSAAATTSTQAGSSASNSSSGKYIVPGLRNKEAAEVNITVSSSKRANKNQPNILDVSEFPSLGDVASVNNSSSSAKVSNEQKFEQPKRGAKNETTKISNRIDLENKFDALSS